MPRDYHLFSPPSALYLVYYCTLLYCVCIHTHTHQLSHTTHCRSNQRRLHLNGAVMEDPIMLPNLRFLELKQLKGVHD